MIPVLPKHVSVRYNNMYASHQHEHYHHPHPRQQQPVMWQFVRSSVISPTSLPFTNTRGYHHPSSLAMVNRHGPLEVPATNFVAMSPSMQSIPLGGQARTSFPGSNAPVSSPLLTPNSATATVAPASGKLKQNEEYEAAEVLLGLTTRDEKDQGKTTPPSTKTKSDGASAAPTKKPNPFGQVTDESSTGTTSPTPPLLCTEDPNTWFRGSISLSLPEDDDVLSPLHCFMRKYCVEAFSASAQDVATPRYGKSHGFKVRIHR
jgi:hypothetical protein